MAFRSSLGGIRARLDSACPSPWRGLIPLVRGLVCAMGGIAAKRTASPAIHGPFSEPSIGRLKAWLGNPAGEARNRVHGPDSGHSSGIYPEVCGQVFTTNERALDLAYGFKVNAPARSKSHASARDIGATLAGIRQIAVCCIFATVKAILAVYAVWRGSMPFDGVLCLSTGFYAFRHMPAFRGMPFEVCTTYGCTTYGCTTYGCTTYGCTTCGCTTLGCTTCACGAAPPRGRTVKLPRRTGKLPYRQAA